MYNKFITNSLTNTDEETIERWYTYEAIMTELIGLNKINLFEEVKYRLTGGEDPNDIILDIINRDNVVKTALWAHSCRLRDYKNEDLLKRFY
jgi:hypothetical protein